MEDHRRTYPPASGGLERLIWAFTGQAVLPDLGDFSLRKRTSRFSILAGLHFPAAALLILSRRQDDSFITGTTASGPPAASVHL